MKFDSNKLTKVLGLVCLFVGGLIMISAVGITACTLYNAMHNAPNMDNSQNQIDNATLMKASIAVQNFAGDKYLKVSFIRWSNDTYANYAMLENGLDSYGLDSYYYNPMTDMVEAVLYYNNTLNSDDAKLTNAQAFDIAMKFAQEHYVNFSSNGNMKLIESKLIDHHVGGKGYSFMWNEMINGAYTPNRVTITVNPADGSIINYVGKKYQPITVSAIPKISKDTASKIASGQYPNLTITSSNTQLCIINPYKDMQQLVWNVQIHGVYANTTGLVAVVNSTETIPTAGLISGEIVTIDATTGKILNVDSEV